jgi:hypothetical protein
LLVIGLVPLAIASGSANASIIVDGTVSEREWDAVPVLATPLMDPKGKTFQLRVTSDESGLYFLAEHFSISETPLPDIRWGLVGNEAPWRWRVHGESSAKPQFEYGDDSVFASKTGEPADILSVPYPKGITMAGGFGSDFGVKSYTHELFVPWSLMLDGKNGWDPAAKALTLAIAGATSFEGTAFTDPEKHDAFAWGDQRTYAYFTAGVPSPGGATLLCIGAMAILRRRR